MLHIILILNVFFLIDLLVKTISVPVKKKKEEKLLHSRRCSKPLNFGFMRLHNLKKNT